LDEEGYDADYATLEDKYGELSEPGEKIFFRASEKSARPEAIKALEDTLTKVVNLMEKWKTSLPQVTEEERTGVLDEVEKVRQWIAEKTEAQEAANPTEDPIFTSAEVPKQTKTIESKIGRLSRKPKPKPKKEGSNETNAAKAEEGNNRTNTTEGDTDNMDDGSDESKTSGDSQNFDESSEDNITKDSSESSQHDASEAPPLSADENGDEL